MNAEDFDAQFYPTPPQLAARAWAKFKNRNFVRILEPQAGHGDLAQACPDWECRCGRPSIDCCEIDLRRHAVLRAKGLNVVGIDFLRFGSAASYSHIACNPPFAEGAAHVLKAWDILWDGEIVAIVNAETVRNPYSSERQRLARLIEAHGEIEFVEDAFCIAERRSDVEVALVYLRKTADLQQDIIGEVLDGLRDDAASAESLGAGYQEAQALALPNSVIENSVAAFDAAVRTAREAVFAQARAGYYAALLGETLAVRNGGGCPAAAADSIETVQRALAERYGELKDRAWAGILRSSNVTARLSSAAQRRLEKEFEKIKQLEFTAANIYGFLCGLAHNQGEVQIGMACDVFDLITKYHSDNTVFYKGWKSNDKHRSCGMRIKTTRFVLPGHSRDSCYSSSLPWESKQLLGDFDKVFAMLDGKSAPEVGLVEAFERHYQALSEGARVSSSYFDVRYYPGIGTIHFFSRGKALIDRLNRLVGRHRQWLPPEGTRVSDAFWLQFERAEKFDKALRAQVSTGPGRSWSWNQPLYKLFSGDAAEREAAAREVGEALTAIQQRDGICADWLMAEEPQQELLLLV